MTGRPKGYPIRRRILRSSLAALVLWTLWAFGFETIHAFRDLPPPLGAPPSQWTLRAPAALELGHALTAVDLELPADSLVAVGTRGLSASEDFFFSLWACYRLPHHDVVRARQRWPLDRADYLFLYRSSLDEFKPEAVATVFVHRPEQIEVYAAGTLYRIPRP